MRNTSPTISIVTPCLNSAAFIDEAIQSVINQDYPSVEHIVVDGGSTDGTAEILKSYTHLRVVCEPDNNLYDALNKGIRLATGDVIGHLNSDDLYERNVFGLIAKEFIQDPELETVCGGATVFSLDGSLHPVTLREITSLPEKDLTFQNILFDAPIINARFFRRRVYQNICYYDTDYRIAADRKFLLTVLLAGVRSKALEHIVYHYRHHPLSLTINYNTRVYGRKGQEYLKLYEEVLGSPDTPDALVVACKKAHSRITIEAVFHKVYNHDYPEALSIMKRGCKENLKWPFLLLWMVTGRALRFLIKRAYLALSSPTKA